MRAENSSTTSTAVEITVATRLVNKAVIDIAVRVDPQLTHYDSSVGMAVCLENFAILTLSAGGAHASASIAYTGVRAQQSLLVDAVVH